MLFSKGLIQMWKEYFLNVDYGFILYLKGDVLSLGAAVFPQAIQKELRVLYMISFLPLTWSKCPSFKSTHISLERAIYRPLNYTH